MLADWQAFVTYVLADLKTITGIKDSVEGDITQDPKYSTNKDMLGYVGLLGEGGSIVQNVTGSEIAALDRVRVRIGIACPSTLPSGSHLSATHYLLQEWRGNKWASDQSFGGTCQWHISTLIVDRVSPLPCCYFDIEITLG